MEHSQIPKDQADGQASKQSAAVKRLTSKLTPVTLKEPVCVTIGSFLEVTLAISLPAGCYLTQDVSSEWQVMVFRQQEGGVTVLLFSFCHCKKFSRQVVKFCCSTIQTRPESTVETEGLNLGDEFRKFQEVKL